MADQPSTPHDRCSGQPGEEHGPAEQLAHRRGQALQDLHIVVVDDIGMPGTIQRAAGAIPRA